MTISFYDFVASSPLKQAVTQLSVLLRSNLLLSLSDGTISVHDIGVQTNPNNGTRTPVISIRTQLKAKQAVLFALDTSTPECRLCVATAKKRLCFYRLAIGSKVSCILLVFLLLY